MPELNTIYNIDCLTGLKDIEPQSINCCVTSPPYYGLRDYGVDGQIGLEATPEEYMARLVAVFREVKRVLRDDGCLWINIGDSYRDKSLIGIPWMLAFALRADGWYLRQDIIWAKPNPMPESVTDRCTKSHEYIFLLSKSAKYYYDAAAISEPVTQSPIERLGQDVEHQQGSERVPGKNSTMKAVPPRYGGNKYTENPEEFNRTKSSNAYDYRPFRNKRDVWTVSTQPFKEAHFATFPPKLIEPCILAGCPIGGVVLDPFMGSGTTAKVAIELQRNYIGFEINCKYIDIANDHRLDAVQLRMVE